MAMVLDASGSIVSSPQASIGHHLSSSSSLAFTPSPTSWRRAVKSASCRASFRRRSFSAACIVCETKEAPAGKVDDTTFKQLVLESELPVLVDFWAPWCGPCRMLDPVIDSIAEKYKGKIKCFKVNTDECSKTATDLGIRSIPTCMIFKQGERLDTVIGCVPETTLTAVIDKYITS